MLRDFFRLLFGRFVPLHMFSTWTVYLHATKANSNTIGQYCKDFKQKPDTQYQNLVSLVYRLCIYMQISDNKD